MPDQLQLRGGTTAEHSTFTGASKEVTVDTTKKTVVVHDGTTVGGLPLMRQDGSNSALALGSAAAPSISFTGDTNTGLFSPGADTLAFAEGGVEAARIDSSGRLLVGTSSNSGANLLQVNSDALVNGLTAGRGGGAISTNTVVGIGALQANTTGGSNTAIGLQPLYSNTTGVGNTALGYYALFTNTTGGSNTAIGAEALITNTTGSSNTANGASALHFNTTGSNNTANGYRASISNTTGSSNTANGVSALFTNLTGNSNTANGHQSLYYNTTGSSNTANGVDALQSNSTGSNNTCLGYNSGFSLTTGSNNTIIGSIQGTAALANTVIIGAGSTERLRIDSGGVISITAGITFPATAVASADANTLDDYEEGTWTPTQGGGLTVVGTFSSGGIYIKVGRKITVQGFVAGSTSVAATANGLLCGGLPFSGVNTGTANFIGSGSNSNLSALINVWVNNGVSDIYAVTTMAATGAIYFTVSYFGP